MPTTFNTGRYFAGIVRPDRSRFILYGRVKVQINAPIDRRAVPSADDRPARATSRSAIASGPSESLTLSAQPG